jgi:hypothetical protein
MTGEDGVNFLNRFEAGNRHVLETYGNPADFHLLAPRDPEEKKNWDDNQPAFSYRELMMFVRALVN